jgi:hypothetical protein
MSDPHSKQFEIVRQSHKKQEELFLTDGKHCPACGQSTEVGDDPTRRYCTSKHCSALILEVAC